MRTLCSNFTFPRSPYKSYGSLRSAVFTKISSFSKDPKKNRYHSIFSKLFVFMANQALLDLIAKNYTGDAE